MRSRANGTSTTAESLLVAPRGPMPHPSDSESVPGFGVRDGARVNVRVTDGGGVSDGERMGVSVGVVVAVLVIVGVCVGGGRELRRNVNVPSPLLVTTTSI
jgi:hypothetical protein